MLKKYSGKSAIGFPFFLVLLYVNVANAQVGPKVTSEVGFGLGGMTYTGDLVRGYDVTLNRPAATAFYRSNLGKAVSFKIGLTGGKVIGREEPIDAFAGQRSASFDVFVLEVAPMLEYHFLNWRGDKARVRWTPYFFGGVGLFGITGAGEKPVDYSNVQASFPFGMGFKYILNPKWQLGVEFGARKTLFDYLDNVSEGDPGVKFQGGSINDNDMYYFTGVTLTYSFYNIPCPTSPYK